MPRFNDRVSSSLPLASVSCKIYCFREKESQLLWPADPGFRGSPETKHWYRRPCGLFVSLPVSAILRSVRCSFRCSSPPCASYPLTAVCCPAAEWVQAKRTIYDWNAAVSTTAHLRTGDCIRFLAPTFSCLPSSRSLIAASGGSSLVWSSKQPRSNNSHDRQSVRLTVRLARST